ncbi:branched-chain amino acid transaminase [Candidatus Woesearchaeota archaeon]|nr:branched-chain amino acid transaminase [Candidatus Woesearchaeota archaeon]
MEKTQWIWMNGTFVPWEQATVHFLTHSLHYSGALFEGIRCYKTRQGPAILRLDDHIMRLYHSAHIMDMPVAWTQKHLRDACIATIRKNNVDECYIRPLLYYGEGEMGINTIGKTADAGIAIWKWGAYLGDGLEKGVRVMTSSWRKPAPDAMPLNAKVSGNYTQAILAKREAKKMGYDEAILLDAQGHVAEGPGENVFLVAKGTLVTPPTTSALEGITRDTVLQLGEKYGIPWKIEQVTRDQCYTADELFFTGTAAEITPIVEYDNRKMKGIGPLTKLLQEAFFRVVHGECPSPWLTYA